MILTIDSDGKPNKWATIETLPGMGRVFRAGATVMVIESVDLHLGIIKFRPLDSVKDKEFIAWLEKQINFVTGDKQ